MLLAVSWAAPASAHDGAERVSLVLAKLPPRDSAAYKAILAQAGKPAIETLSLTKAEVWSFAAGSLAAVRTEATRHGASVRTLGKDWNVFRLGASRVKLGTKLKAMLERIGASRTTASYTLVTTPRPAVFEYALTRDAGVNWPSEGAPRIVVHLNEQTTVAIARKGVTLRADSLVWRGEVVGTGAPATIMWWPGATMSGRVAHEGRIYSIRCIRGNIHVVVEMREDKMPPEHAPMPGHTRPPDRS